MPYKKRKTPSSRKNLHIRPNDRLGLKSAQTTARNNKKRTTKKKIYNYERNKNI